jgi:hypothetical protein
MNHLEVTMNATRTLVAAAWIATCIATGFGFGLVTSDNDVVRSGLGLDMPVAALIIRR